MTAALFLHESGSAGRSLLLLHGLAGSWRFWQTALPALEQQHRVTCPDLLGFGRSPWPEDVPYTVETHMEALVASVLPRLEAPFDLVGHSLGAVLALELAARAPERVRSLTLLALPFYEDEQQARAHLRRTRWGRWLLERPLLAHATCTLICQRRRLWRHVLPALLPRVPRAVVVDSLLHSFHSISSSLHECCRWRSDSA